MSNGKGDTYRPVHWPTYAANWDGIFRKPASYTVGELYDNRPVRQPDSGANTGQEQPKACPQAVARKPKPVTGKRRLPKPAAPVGNRKRKQNRSVDI